MRKALYNNKNIGETMIVFPEHGLPLQRIYKCSYFNAVHFVRAYHGSIKDLSKNTKRSGNYQKPPST